MDSFADQLDKEADSELIDNLSKCLHVVYLVDLSPHFDVFKLRSIFQFVSKLMVANNFIQQDFEQLPTIFPNIRVFLCESNSVDVHLSFISKFKHLYFIALRHPFSLEDLNEVLKNNRFFILRFDQNEQKNFTIRVGYKQIVSPERFFVFSSSSTGERQQINFGEKEQLLKYLENNDLAKKG